MSNKKEYQKELNKVNKHIEIINNELIKGLQTIGIEFIDYNRYITRYEALQMRKDKLLYLLALE